MSQDGRVESLELVTAEILELEVPGHEAGGLVAEADLPGPGDLVEPGREVDGGTEEIASLFPAAGAAVGMHDDAGGDADAHLELGTHVLVLRRGRGDSVDEVERGLDGSASIVLV